MPYDADALVGEHLLQCAPGLGFLPGGQPGPHQHGDFRSKSGEQLGLLKRHVAAAEHQQRLRHLGQLHRSGRGQIVHLIQALDRRDARPRAGGDQIVLGLDDVGCVTGGGDPQHRRVRGAGEAGVPVPHLPSM